MNPPKIPACTRWLAIALAAFLHNAASLSAQPAPVRVGEPLPAWSEGELDIHHINTGLGESSFLILPDGTTLLVDAGATAGSSPLDLPPKPDASRAPGEWIARYIVRALRSFPGRKIDYAVISHFHGDHMGSVSSATPRASAGDYQLSGLSEVAEHLPIARIIDRNWPDYNWPVPLDDPSMRNYRKFVRWQVENRGLVMEQFQPGRSDQLVLRRRAAAYPNFEIRNLMANGRVWTGVADNTRSLFPPLADLSPDSYPSENKCSIAFRVSYGSFDYFTGGDLDSLDADVVGPSQYWKDTETPVAMVTGPVEAMKANHHGAHDANNAAFLGILRPRVIIIDSRTTGQPAINVYLRMTRPPVYPGPRDIFVTNVTDATTSAYSLDKLKSKQGHVVLRVTPGGATYHVYVLDDSDEEQRVKAVFGPYTSS